MQTYLTVYREKVSELCLKMFKCVKNMTFCLSADVAERTFIVERSLTDADADLMVNNWLRVRQRHIVERVAKLPSVSNTKAKLDVGFRLHINNQQAQLYNYGGHTYIHTPRKRVELVKWIIQDFLKSVQKEKK